MAIDILKALSSQNSKTSPGMDLKSFDDEENQRTSEAIQSLLGDISPSVIQASRSPSAEKKQESQASKPKLVPKYDTSSEEGKRIQDSIQQLSEKIEKSLPETFSMTGKTTEQIRKETEKASETDEEDKITKEQQQINKLQERIDALGAEKKKKKQEVESYLDKAVLDMTKSPEGMGLLEVVGRSMLAIAPGLIASKFAGYRGGQYAQEGANKALENMMETEETRRQAAQKIQAEMSKVRASLTKEEIDDISALQKELIKGQIDLQTLPIKSQIELQRLLSGKELTKDQTLDYMDKLIELKKLQQVSKEMRPEAKGKGTGAGGPKPTIAQQTIDREFGKEYSNFVTEGGFANYGTQINQLTSGIEAMKNSDYISGPAVDLIPGIFKPTSRRVQNEVLAAASGLMKQVLGGQFAKVEGEGVLKRLFDPQAEEEVNIMAAQRFLTQIERAKALKEDQIDYYEKTGTLVGWPGSKKMKELETEMAGKSGSTKEGAGGPTLKLTTDLYKKMTKAQMKEYQNATPAGRLEIIKKLQGD